MNITKENIEQHIQEVLQTNEHMNLLLKATIENELRNKFINDEFSVNREIVDFIISSLQLAKIRLNSIVEGTSCNFRGVNLARYLGVRETLLEEWNRLIKVFEIVKAAKSEETDFFDKFSDCMTDTGDRTVDYCGYTIPIDEDFNLFIDFVDFGVHSYYLIKSDL